MNTFHSVSQNKMRVNASTTVFVLSVLASHVNAYSVVSSNEQCHSRSAQHCGDVPVAPAKHEGFHRRRALLSSGSAAAASLAFLMGRPQVARAAAAAVQDSLDVDSFLKTGVDSGGPMGVSSQAGKSRPETGVVLRDGGDVQQDKQGNVLAEPLDWHQGQSSGGCGKLSSTVAIGNRTRL